METNDHIPEYLVAYLQGDADEEQTKLAIEWLNIPENQSVYKQLKKIDSLTADLQLFKKFTIREGKQKVRKKYRANKLQTATLWMQRVAALFFIPVLLGGIWYYFQQNELRKDLVSLMVTQEIITQPGTKTHLFLPDSTEVWLNSSSTLRFPSVFAGEERRIELDGEAYFKVFRNKRKPFVVNTGPFEVEALGTAFNLSAYLGDISISTTLEEGKVKVTDHEMAGKTMTLDPGVQLNFNVQDKTYKARNVRVQDVIAWKDGVLIFNETPFYEVAAKLGRWFNADVKITDQSIVNYRITGTFTSESLSQVLELLTISTPISYSESKRHLLDNKNFSKQEIKIWKNSNTNVKQK